MYSLMMQLGGLVKNKTQILFITLAMVTFLVACGGEELALVADLGSLSASTVANSDNPVSWKFGDTSFNNVHQDGVTRAIIHFTVIGPKIVNSCPLYVDAIYQEDVVESMEVLEINTSYQMQVDLEDGRNVGVVIALYDCHHNPMDRSYQNTGLWSGEDLQIGNQTQTVH